MLYKEDWSDARERLIAWWGGEVVDRPVISVSALRTGSDHIPWDNWDFSRYPDDPQRALDNYEAMAKRTFFGGEAFPNCWINLGAGAVAAFLGADASFYSDTVWFEKGFGWEDLEDIHVDPQNAWWRRVQRDTRLATEVGADKFVVGMTDLGGILDIAHSLRGKKRLMIDLFRNPEKVKELNAAILEAWHECYDELNGIIQSGQEGTSAWMGIWCRERWYSLQCDYAYMLSPSKFRDFVLDEVAEQCRRLDHTIYHLDGYGQIPHVDGFLGIPELDGIQWVPGAGKPGCGDRSYFPMYKKIREAGKSLVLNLAPDEIEPICRELGSEGIHFGTGCRSQEQAEKLLRDSEQWV